MLGFQNIDVSTHVVLYCILNYRCFNAIYFSLEYCGVEHKVEAVPPL